MKLKLRFMYLGLMMLIAMVANASGEIVGRVTNFQTGRPIEGAFVIATWMGHGGDMVGTHTWCKHVEVVKTNADGVYSIPTGKWGNKPDVFTYYPGFDEYRERPIRTDKDADDDRRAKTMRASHTSANERLTSFQSYDWLHGCENDNILTVLSPLYTAIDKELKKLNVATPLYQFANPFMTALYETVEQRKADRARGILK